MLPAHGHLLRIFLSESDRHEGRPLYEWLVQEAKATGLAGATVFRAIEGYGAHSQIHTAKMLDLSSVLPVVVEIVDELEKIEKFLPTVNEVVKEGLATVEKVQIRFYRSRK
jgi:hypothetical protein